MTYRTLIATTALCSLIALNPGSASAAPTHLRIVAEINEARGARGLAPLRHSRSLRASTRSVARELARRRLFRHPARLRISRRFQLRGETLALIRRRSAGRIVRAWLRSPGHRRVLLNPRYRWVGAAGAQGRFRPSMVWVAHFGRR